MNRFTSSFLFRILPWVVLIHALAFMLFWLTNRLFFASTNDYLTELLNRRFAYVSLLIGISALVAAWSGVRLLLVYTGRTHRLVKVTTWIYGAISLLYVIFFYGSFWLLFSKSAVQLVRIGQMLGYFRILADTLLLAGLAALMGVTFIKLMKRKALESRGLSRFIPLALVFVVLWSLPLFFPPTSVRRNPLPSKPRLIAHRGASMLAPENTIASAILAAELGVYGLETDVHMSNDGQLFLMHDDTFERTTDIQAIFSGREKEPVENFTLQEISQLNAGKWFVEQDPYGAIRSGRVPVELIAAYEQQKVPLLEDWLAIAREHHLAFRFDLKGPPTADVYGGTLFETALHQVHRAGIDAQIWFLVSLPQLQMMKGIAPDMLPTYSADYQALPPAAELVSPGYKIVNVEYGIAPQWIKQYKDAGLWVDVYTVDEPWQFSRLWLLGVDSITTSNAGVMAGLARPVFSLAYGMYVLVWGLLGLACLGLLVGMLYPLVSRQTTLQAVS